MTLESVVLLQGPEQNALGNLLVLCLLSGIFAGAVLDWLWIIGKGTFWTYTKCILIVIDEPSVSFFDLCGLNLHKLIYIGGWYWMVLIIVKLYVECVIIVSQSMYKKIVLSYISRKMFKIVFYLDVHIYNLSFFFSSLSNNQVNLISFFGVIYILNKITCILI